jgi:hypothetical protein
VSSANFDFAKEGPVDTVRTARVKKGSYRRSKRLLGPLAVAVSTNAA